MEKHKYYGQKGIDSYLNDNFINNKRDGFFVECGAGEGVIDSSCKFFEETLGWTGINIEPVPKMYTRLVENRPKCFNSNFALSDKEEKASFLYPIHHKLEFFGNGSLTHTKEHLADLKRLNYKFETYDVQCIKFSSLWKSIGKDIRRKGIDLFVLDVEGHELQALEGILPTKPKILCIEYPWIGLNNIEEKIIPYSYILAGIHHNNAIFVLHNKENT